MQKQTEFFRKKLTKRKAVGTYRSLQTAEGKIDFWSNDYLGFARSKELTQRAEDFISRLPYPDNGATGSRLISGNSEIYEATERFIADFHGGEAALLFNSGYDANLGLFSCIAAPEDTVLYDELIHASVHDGLRLSRAKVIPFSHNDVQDLEEKAAQITTGNLFVAVESVYSMNGDVAPLREITELAERRGAAVIVDEAHGIGVFGERGGGLVNAVGAEEKIFARVYTYGKAFGAHGAAVVGSALLREYLINYARSFIFTTALPVHNWVKVRTAYDLSAQNPQFRQRLLTNIKYFTERAKPLFGTQILPSHTQIQSIIIAGNEEAKTAAATIKAAGFAVKAILYPTVPRDKERIRICLHGFNTPEEIDALIKIMHEATTKKSEIQHFASEFKILT